MISTLLLLPLLSGLALAAPTPMPTTPHLESRGSGPGSRIRSISNPDLCVTVQNGFAGNGARIALSDCWDDQETFAKLQQWSVIGPQTGQVDLIWHTDLCLDAGDQTNGAEVTVSRCGEGQRQSWDIESLDDGKFRFKINDQSSQCLDVIKDSTSSYNKPYISVKDLQMWECHPDDHPDISQQYFELF
ncbi:uncharacterized protein IL334_000523 [Kwoniella shivajii]|uniref:Ricin B lectin domain-containing protein n=1 Tax=Kwoniella shivajii TaxID=564305 RepID=A0ABZ1CPP8_9TREE|nr:hypothetical protein IL334_000523 [Kwoniella shivajii]